MKTNREMGRGLRGERPATDQTTELATLLRGLHERRWERQGALRGQRRRRSMSGHERQIVLAKTAGRCHICGGEIDGAWQADHVLAHSAGGRQDADNYLAAHVLCNNYRWDYLPEEFQWILKMGVWAKTKIERRSRLGREMAEAFVTYEAQREHRRKPRA